MITSSSKVIVSVPSPVASICISRVLSSALGQKVGETGTDFRTVRIQFEEDDKWIEIIGTFVIPEFGTIVTMILLIAVTTTIILSKSKFSIKYN